MKSSRSVLRQKVANGIRWNVAAGLVAKAATTIAYVALGWFLTDEEFGVYAFVLGVSVLGRAFQDRGVREVLISKTLLEFGAYCRPVLTYGLIANTLAAVGLLLIGQAFRDGQPDSYSTVLFLVSASIPASALWAVASAKLSLQYRFAEYASIMAVSTVLQYSVAVLLGALGFGAVGLAAGIAISTLVRSGLGWMVIRRDVGKSAAPVEPFLGDVAWLVAASLAVGLYSQGDYLVAGIMLPSAVVGTYYFAYQLPVQITVLLGSATHQVLLPLMADANREHPGSVLSILTRSSRGLVLATGGAGLVLAVGAPFIEELLWNGRWKDAVPSIQVLSLALPTRALIQPAQALLLGTGRFRTWAFTAVFLAVGVCGGAYVGSSVGKGDVLLLTVSTSLLGGVAAWAVWWRVAMPLGDRSEVASSLMSLLGAYVVVTGPGWLFVLSVAFHFVSMGSPLFYLGWAVLAAVATAALLFVFNRHDLVELYRLLPAPLGRRVLGAGS